MSNLSYIEKKYLRKKIFLYQNFNLNIVYNTIIKNKYLYLNFYNKHFIIKSRFQSQSCLRNIRRNAGYPIRGQRTSSNGKTAKKRLWKKS